MLAIEKMDVLKLNEYLNRSEYIDFDNAEVKALAKDLAHGQKSKVDIAKECFEYVRDQIHHSWDYKSNPVTIKASDVLKHKTGYCYAKSHLLAALLRANKIPTALCYQRLTITDKPPYCLHGLNAIFLDGYGWYRVDARGNNSSVNAEFCPPVEKLAFELLDQGERDIDGFLVEPKTEIIKLLSTCTTVYQVHQRLNETDVQK